jgi:hypothetical protein
MVGLLNVLGVLPKAIIDAVQIALLASFFSIKDLYAIDYGFRLFESDSVSIRGGRKT